jgi:hypothetical protein
VRVAETGLACGGRIPLWLKVAWTLFAAATFASYSLYYSFAHSFLWFSSIGLLLSCASLWLESPLLASMQAVGVVALEFAYTLDLLFRLATGSFLIGLSVYLFQGDDAPLWVRAFSLFHVPLPFLLLWLLARLGYDRRAWWLQTGLAWVLLPVCYLFTDPADNVNWVFGPRAHGWHAMPSWGWAALLMVALPAFVYLPTHWALRGLFPEPATNRAARPAPRESRNESGPRGLQSAGSPHRTPMPAERRPDDQGSVGGRRRARPWAYTGS